MTEQAVGTNVMRNTPFAFVVRGENVVFQLDGRDALTVHWTLANKFAHLWRHSARKAKQNAGDAGVQIIGFAELTDANMDELQLQKSRDGTAVFAAGAIR